MKESSQKTTFFSLLAIGFLATSYLRNKSSQRSNDKNDSISSIKKIKSKSSSAVLTDQHAIRNNLYILSVELGRGARILDVSNYISTGNANAPLKKKPLKSFPQKVSDLELKQEYYKEILMENCADFEFFNEQELEPLLSNVYDCLIPGGKIYITTSSPITTLQRPMPLQLLQKTLEKTNFSVQMQHTIVIDNIKYKCIIGTKPPKSENVVRCSGP